MSTAKEFIFGEEARNRLLEGIDLLVNAVSGTLGPTGNNAAIESLLGIPNITNKGNNIANEIVLKDQYANMGVALAKKSAQEMKEICGKGVTTHLILLRAIAKNALKEIASGLSPVHLKQGIEKALEAILNTLKTDALNIQTLKEIQNIATTAASGDRTVGASIAEAIEKVGKQGVIAIEEGKGINTTIEIVRGMQFDSGYASSSFCTKEHSLSAEMNNPRILVTDKRISCVQDLLPILQSVVSSSSELLIIAEDVEAEALSTLVINKLKGILKVCAVKVSSFGDNHREILKDIAILTGAKFISEELGLSLKDATFKDLGSAERAIVYKDKTVLITNQAQKKQVQKRKAKLISNAAIIHVGGTMKTIAKQKQQIFKEALNCTKAAIDEGVVLGAGIGLFRASQSVNLLLSPEEAVGAQVLIRACSAPLKQIIINSGLDSAIVYNDLLNKEPQYGLNAITGKVENLLKSGIMDPIKILRTALQHAVSTASLVLFSEVLIGSAIEER